MDTNVDKFSVQQKTTDGASEASVNYYDNPNFSKWYGYYKQLPELKKGIDAFAIWVLGKGYETDNRTQIILNNISGRGDEDFMAIMWNMLVMKKVNGDSFAEIIREPNSRIIINIKPLSPQNIRVRFNKKGIITGYIEKRNNKPYEPEDILHFSNDRTADEMGGTSVVPVVQWNIDAKNEAMAGYRRILHRSTIRVLYIDEQDTTRMANIKRDYAAAINKGELLIMPASVKDATFQDLSTPPIQSFLEWIRYLDNQIFLNIGTPKVIMGSVDSIPESGGKISYLSYEQIYSRETRELEADLLAQLGMEITFNPPVSIAEGVADERSNAQTGFQPNDVTAGVGK